MILMEDGFTQRIDQVQVGEKVASVSDDGELAFVDVVYVPHLKNNLASPFLQIECQRDDNDDQRSKLMVTPDHFVFKSTTESAFEAFSSSRADEVEVGDWLWELSPSASGPCQVVATKEIPEGIENGVYTLFTENGQLVVDNILASSYAGTSSQYYDHAAAHMGTVVHRFVHYIMGQSSSRWFRYLNDHVLEPLVAAA